MHVGMPGLRLLEHRHLAPARRAPAGPQVHHCGLATKSRQRGRRALQVAQDQFGERGMRLRRRRRDQRASAQPDQAGHGQRRQREAPWRAPAQDRRQGIGPGGRQPDQAVPAAVAQVQHGQRFRQIGVAVLPEIAQPCGEQAPEQRIPQGIAGAGGFGGGCRSGRAAGAPAARRPAGRARPTAAARRVQSERPGAETDRGRHEVCGGEGGNRAGKPSMIIHRGRRRGMRYAARLSPIPLESATCKVRVPGTSCLISAITPIPSPPAPSKPSPTWSAHVAACAPAGPTRPSPMDWATGRRTCVPGASRTAALRGNSGPSSWAT